MSACVDMVQQDCEAEILCVYDYDAKVCRMAGCNEIYDESACEVRSP